MQRFTVVIERDEDGVFLGYVPALPGCHTCGATLAEVDERIREAIGLCLAVRKQRGEGVGESRLVGVHEVEVAA